MGLGKIGKYEKLDVLGHGVSGIVYLAWDSLLGKHVALKEISLQAADEEKFMEEARVLDRLRHPNIVQVNGVDKIEGHLIIDMEYVKGTNLHEYMRKHGKLPVREALSIAVQVCDALDFAHRNHTIHRDIKPANILINREGTAKIVDFGLAEILGSGSYAGGAGTYAYMAPEDFESEESSDHRSDIWAAGVTLYEMLTGKRPFQAAKAKDPFSWKQAVGEDELPPIDSSLPKELEQVISHALAKNKYERYQSAGVLYRDLSRILSSIGGPVRLGGLVEQAAESTLDAEPDELEEDNTWVKILPDELNYGKLRKGESCTQKMKVRVPGRGKIKARVAYQPGWIQVTPQSFDRRKQSLMVTADTESIWEPGVYEDELVLKIDEQDVSVPVTMNVLSPRRRFYEVAWWYVPLFVFCLLPLLARLVGSTKGVDPASLITMGLLSAMLLIISVVADLGILEKLIPAASGAIGLGAVIGAIGSAGSKGGLSRPEDILVMAIIGMVLSFMVAFQLLTASKWQAWAVVLALTAIGCTAILAH